MVLSVSAGTQYSLLVAVPCLVALALGKRVFLPEVSSLALVRDFLRTDWKFLGVAWAITYLVDTVAMHFHVTHTFTNTIYSIEGATVETFQAIASTPLTVLFTVVYLVGLPFVVLFTYFKVKAHDEEQAYRYALAYIFLVLFSVPFFILFPVKITSLYLSGVQPLMYQLSPIIQHGVYATDTLVKSFPSLHTGLSVLAFLYARKADRAYAYTIGVLTAGIVFSTLYLGVHWLTDAAFGVVLVLLAYYASQRVQDPTDPFASVKAALRRMATGLGLGRGRGSHR